MEISIGLIIGFLMGIVFERYVAPMGDVTLQVFANRKRLNITKLSKEIEEVENEKAVASMEAAEIIAMYEKDIWTIKKDMREDQTHAIGFRYGEGDMVDCDCEECDDDCDDEDCEDCMDNGCNCEEKCKECKCRVNDDIKAIGFKSSNIKC